MSHSRTDSVTPTGSVAIPLGPVVERPTTSVYFRYTDHDGGVHIVDSLSLVPRAARSRVQRIELTPPPRAHSDSASPKPPETPWHFDGPSFGVGAGFAVMLGLVLWMLRRRPGLVLKIALPAAAATLLAGAYFAWLRKMSGHKDSQFSSPQDLVQDARSAVQSMNRRQKEQERLLREIEREAR
ncbi:hypothetical protein ACFL5O_04305 [Myxococcota bacterium]